MKLVDLLVLLNMKQRIEVLKEEGAIYCPVYEGQAGNIKLSVAMEHDIEKVSTQTNRDRLTVVVYEHER